MKQTPSSHVQQYVEAKTKASDVFGTSEKQRKSAEKKAEQLRSQIEANLYAHETRDNYLKAIIKTCQTLNQQGKNYRPEAILNLIVKSSRVVLSLSIRLRELQQGGIATQTNRHWRKPSPQSERRKQRVERLLRNAPREIRVGNKRVPCSYENATAQLKWAQVIQRIIGNVISITQPPLNLPVDRNTKSLHFTTIGLHALRLVVTNVDGTAQVLDMIPNYTDKAFKIKNYRNKKSIPARPIVNMEGIK